MADTVYQIIREQASVFVGIGENIAELSLQTVHQAEHEQKIIALQESKRQLYEQYIFGELALEVYMDRKAELDNLLVREKQVHHAILTQVKQREHCHAIHAKRQEVLHAINSVDSLTPELSEALIKRIYVFPENRVEIEYVTEDIFEKG